MKKLLLSLCFFTLLFFSVQAQKNELIEKDTSLVIERSGVSHSTDRGVILNSILPTIQRDPEIYKQIFDNDSTLRTRATIFYIYNPFESDTSDKFNPAAVNVIVLNQEKTGLLISSKQKKNAWSDYLLNSNKVLLYMIGPTATYGTEFSVKNGSSFFSQNLNEMIDLISKYPFPKVMPSRDTCRMVLLDKRKINPPSTLSFNVPYELNVDTLKKPEKEIVIKLVDSTSEVVVSYPYSGEKKTLDLTYTLNRKKKDLSLDLPEFYKPKISRVPKTFSYKIHERNFLSLKVGISATDVKLKQFSFNNDTLKVSLDSAGKSQWTANLYVSAELFPFGRDIDRFEAIWKKPFYKPWERLGIFGGIKLSKDPLSAFYTGLSVSISKTSSIQFGFSFRNEVVPQVTSVEGITSLDSALEYAKRKYGRSFFVGVSFAPGQISKSLGLGK